MRRSRGQRRPARCHAPSRGRRAAPALEALEGRCLPSGQPLVPPTTVAPLPAVTTSTSFIVSWSGSDGPGRAGIASYDVYVSDNGGPFTPWQTGTAQTSAVFTGQNGHTYAFASTATEAGGQRPPTPAAAEAATAVDVTPVTSRVNPLPAVTGSPTFPVSWSGGEPGGPGIRSFDIA